MKKKIINGIMMVALVAATSTSFVSCKDTNEDVKVELAADIAQLKGRLTTLENKYGDLDSRISTLSARVDKHAEDIATLQSEVDALELWLVEAFAKLVYGVEISGTYNNMLGSINIPGFEPKMLINNYGVATAKGTFPESLDAKDRIEWAAGDELGTNEDNAGFAGYIYANVNRYLDDVPMLSKSQGGDLFDITIANTAGESVEGLVVANVDEEGGATNDLLSWGWTRADNNIYKFAVAYTGKETNKFTPAKINLSQFKDDLKQVWADRNRATGTSKEALGQLVADLYYKLATKDYNMKKYGLKFKWTDATSLTESTADYTADAKSTGNIISYDATKEEAKGLDHIVTSEAELVFATIKPLSFNSGDALAEKVNSITKSTNNLIEKMEPFMDRILNRVKNQVPLKNLDESVFDNIKTNAAGKYVIVVTKAQLAAATGQPIASVNDLEIEIDDIVAPMKSSFSSVNDMIDSFKSALAKVNGTNIGNWIEKFTNKANTLFKNNSDQMLRPVLLAINSEGVVNKVSGVKEVPYMAVGEVTLKPTTYTGELIAPAYAKFVGCKDITADNFNKILFTGDKELKFTPEAGKTYEIVYEAVDFFGNKFYQKYYILGGVK